MLIITDELLKNVEEFKEKLQQHREGKISEFKSFGAPMGIYKEGPKDTYMVRPRIPGGVITLEQLKALSGIAKKYAQQKVRFTTRQDIQLHSVKLECLGDVLTELIQAGFTTRGAGGDGVRNVACSPLSGVAQDEIFDVTPYVKQVGNYMMKDPANVKLPRKYKISFSNSNEDTVNASLSDIGFIAKIVDGKRGFEVYGGGGLGVGASISLKLENFIEDTDALYYVQALKQIFEREGDRSNRQKARLRFVVKRVGEQEFREMVKKEVAALKADKDLKLNVAVNEQMPSNSENKTTLWDSKYKNMIFPQKQAGRFAVYIHPQNGNMSTENLDKVTAYLSTLTYPITIRVTMTQGFFVRDLRAGDVENLLQTISSLATISSIDQSITCAGPTICNFGINNSQGTLRSIFSLFNNAADDIKAALPRIFISGCHNSCGQHQKGTIGFTGKRKKTDDGIVPMYAISFGGRVGPNIAKFGEVYGDIPAKKVPQFLLALANMKVKLGYIDFVQFLQNQDEEVRALVNQFATIESIVENPGLYSDFQ